MAIWQLIMHKYISFDSCYVLVYSLFLLYGKLKLYVVLLITQKFLLRLFKLFFIMRFSKIKTNQKPPLITKINIQIEYVKSVPSHSCEGTLWKYRNKAPHLNIFLVKFRANQLLRISKFLKMMSFGRLTLWRNEFVT